MDIQKTANHWDTQHFSTAFLRAEWSAHPLAQERLHSMLGYLSREEWFIKTRLPHAPVRRGLGIGVGTAATELQLLASGAVEQFDVYDVSPVALSAAREEAQRLGVEERVRFVCEDINRVALPHETYDLVTFIASLHHIEQLEQVLRSCYAALAPGGMMWAAEYIGPDRFEYPDADTAFAERFYRILDPGLKKAWEPELHFPTPEEVILVDPTEAVHSSEIIAMARSIFPKLEIIPTYGTLAFILSWSLNHDALYETEKGHDAFRVILDLDTAMIDSGTLPHYFAYLVGTKPSMVTQR